MQVMNEIVPESAPAALFLEPNSNHFHKHFEQLSNGNAQLRVDIASVQSESIAVQMRLNEEIAAERWHADSLAHHLDHVEICGKNRFCSITLGLEETQTRVKPARELELELRVRIEALSEELSWYNQCCGLSGAALQIASRPRNAVWSK